MPTPNTEGQREEEEEERKVEAGRVEEEKNEK